MFWKRKKVFPVKEKIYKTGSKIDCKEIFTDTLGRKWYEYYNYTLIPATRVTAVTMAIQAADKNITDQILESKIKECLIFMDKGEITSAAHLLVELEKRCHWNGERETLLDLASVYYLIEGENEQVFSPKIKKEKKQFIADNQEAYNFFLEGVFKFTKHCLNTLNTGIPKFLENKD